MYLVKNNLYVLDKTILNPKNPTHSTLVWASSHCIVGAPSGKLVTPITTGNVTQIVARKKNRFDFNYEINNTEIDEHREQLK